jgi:hypothetical protein
MLDWTERKTEIARDDRARGLGQRLHEAAEKASHQRMIDECTKMINQFMKRYLCCRVKWVGVGEGNDYDEIAATLARLRDLESVLSRLYFSRGKAYLALGNIMKARSDLDEAARLR